MPELDADFEISNNNLEAEYEISEGQTFDCSFEIYASGTTWGAITGDIENQTDLQEQFATKADASTVETLSETVAENTGNITNIQNTIDTYGNIVTYDNTDFATAQQGELADSALQPNDNVSELVNDAGYLVSSDLSGYATLNDLATKQDIIDDLTDIRNDASEGASAYSTIQNYGDIVTHNVDEFATSAQGSLADTALQPNDNISELNNDAGYITNSAIPTNYVTTDTTQSVTGTKNFTQINNANSNNLATYNTIQLTNDIGNTNENLRLQGNGDRPKYRSGSNVTSFLALQSDIQTYTAGSGIDITSNAISVTTPVIIDNATGSHSIALGSSSQSTAEGSVAIGDTAKANSTYSTAIGYNAQATNTNSVVIGKQAKSAYPRTVAIGSGAEANANDALVIKGVNNTANSFQVGSYTLLDTSTGLIPNSRIDSSTYATVNYVNNAVQTNSAHFRGNWTDWATVPTDINDYPADDDGNKTPTVNDYMVVQDASDYTLDTLEGTWQFTYTGTWSDNGKAGWLPRFQVNETPLTQAQLDALNSGATSTNIGQIATNTNDISNINTTIGGYGDIVSYNASDFATASQGSKADTALQSGDNISELNNDSGYITGITSSDVTNALGYTPYNNTNPDGFISGITSTDVTNALGYTPYNSTNPNSYQENVIESIEVNGTAQTITSKTVDITVPTDTSDLTNNAGYITGINSNDVTTALGYTPYNSSNPDGYTTNVGTVTSVNNTLPDANGNVTISLTAGANTDLSNLTATGEAHFQEPLISGTNIKTVNNTTLLGSGNIDTSEVFVAEYGTTTFNEIKTALTNGKIVLAKLDSLYYNLTFIDTSVVFQFSRIWQDICYMVQVISTNSWSSENYIYQKTSTAVTHTASTAVGSSTTPVYIASNGTATSTGLSIASSRFDGQWVGKYLEVSTATSAASREHDLSSYLPSDSYSYEVFVRIVLNKSTASNLAVGTVASPITNRTGDNNNFCLYGYTMANSQYSFQSGILPIGTGRKLYSQISTAPSNAGIYLHGYRRIGTNT